MTEARRTPEWHHPGVSPGAPPVRGVREGSGGEVGLSGREPARRTPGTPCWTSLMVHGLAATQEFYQGLFGWEFQPGPSQFGPYVRALLDGRPVAGIGELAPGLRLPVAWTTFLASDDADATAEQIRCCGGTVAVGPLDSGDEGRMAIASDPLGAVFGVWQARGHLGSEGGGAPGTPVWTELLTPETASVDKFYQTVFGCEGEQLAASDEDYVTLTVRGRPVAGVHGVGQSLPRGRGPHWVTYFEVADPEQAANRVTELGGRVVSGPQATATGDCVQVTDPEGAALTLVRTEH
ncbi:VOC family protein [Streptomyces sp. AC536]|nr:VOC family protein [Streptomyces buecherae]QNJ39668.1 VOC family protein [Streptomyces buecherae]